MPSRPDSATRPIITPRALKRLKDNNINLKASEKSLKREITALTKDYDEKLESLNITLAEKDENLANLNSIATRYTDFERQFTELQGLLRTREQKISEQLNDIHILRNEKTALNKVILVLKAEIELKDTEIRRVEASGREAIELYKERLSRIENILVEKNNEIRENQKKINELMESGGQDIQLVKENEMFQLKYNTLFNYHQNTALENAELKVKLNSLQSRYDYVEKERSDYQSLYAKEQQEKMEYQSEVRRLNDKIKASFTSSQMANYFKNTIDSFNKEGNQKNKSMKYVISNMDVELKAGLGKSENNEMLISPPGLGGSNENALSSIKMTIRAVPKITK